MKITVTHNTAQVLASLHKSFEELDRKRSTELRSIAIAAFGELQKESPVLTGRFRSGWDLTLGEPSTFVPPEKPNAVENDPEFTALSESKQAQAVGNVSALTTLKSPERINITNNVVYGQRLNDGWSQQVPAGFLQKVTAWAARRIRKALG